MIGGGQFLYHWHKTDRLTGFVGLWMEYATTFS